MPRWLAALVFSVPGLVLPLAPSLAFAHDAPVPHVHPTFEGRFPSDYGAINVTKLGANSAIPDDGKDDTAALLKVFDEADYDPSNETTPFRRLMPKTVYLPAGTYDVSAPLIVKSSTLRIVGDGPERTLIRLAANTPGFTDRTHPQPVLKTGNQYQPNDPDGKCIKNWANCGFANYIQDLGVVIGPNNPGAIGIRYDVANVGVMRNVSVRAAFAGNSGLYGISFETAPGPGYVDNVTVVGFDYGVYLDDMPINVLTFSDLRVASSRIAGMLNRAKTVVLERFVSDAPVAILMQSPSASVTLVSSTLNGQGGPAVRMEGESPACRGSAGQTGPGPLLYARNVTLRGFDAFASRGGVSLLPGVSHITEWASVKAYVGTTARSDWAGASAGPSLMLGLAAPRMDPLVDPSDSGQWLNAVNFVRAEDQGDIGPALQRAIDLKPRVVYLPWGRYELRSPVNVTGPVQHLDFGFAEVRVGGAAVDRPNVGLVVATDQLTLLDNMATNIWVASTSQRPVLVRDVSAFGGYFKARTGGSAPLFVENVGSKAGLMVEAGARAYARSVDRSATSWSNSGGTLWCLSCNVEERFSPIKTSNGGFTEILGGTIDKHTVLCDGTTPAEPGSGCASDEALFDLTGATSRMSVLMTGTVRSTGSWRTLVTDRSSDPKVTRAYADAECLADQDFLNSRKIALPVYTTPDRSAAPAR